MSIYDQNQVIRILRNLGPINLDYFNDRLRLQKLGYLAQEFGAKDGFPYSWYIRGPYSSSLANVLFMGVEVDAFRDQVQISHEEQTIVNKMQKLLGDGINDPETLELYASVMYLIPNKKLSENDVKGIVDIMDIEKPQYSKEQVRKAINDIISF